MPQDISQELMERWRTGDQEAATAIYHRYAERLIALAASKLSKKLARRVDPEDVVQSAYRSFFLGTREGRYVLEHSGDLWRLLVGITIHKLQHQAERHAAGKRAINQEHSAAGGSHLSLHGQVLSRDPSPLEAAILAEEVEKMFASLEPQYRPILELRLQGYKIEEIAARQNRAERTVRRVLDRIKSQIEAATREL